MFEKYDAYKDSGVEWLGQLPESWDLLPNKHIFKLKKNLVGKRSKEYELLSLTLNGVIKRDMENPEGKFPAEFDTYQEVKSGDFIFCHFDVEETPRTVGLSRFDGMITGAYTVYQVNTEKFCPKFLYYFYLNLDTGKKLKPLYKGLRNTIGKDIFGEFKTFIPNYSEQVKISNFLDQKTIEIDQAIAIKEQQIALLNERKQIVIQKAVTQGLDPNVPMKDSGVEWIGQIPEHWKCVKLKYFIDLIPGYAFKSEEYSSNDKDIKLLRGINVSPNQIKWSETVYWSVEKVDMYKEYLLQEGDIVIAMDRPWVSGGIRIAEISKHDLPALLLQRVARMRGKSGISNKYLKLLLTNDLFMAYFTPMLTGISVPHISGDQIGDFICPLPIIDEQNQIIQYLEQKLSEIEKAKELLLTQIEQLTEYKTTFINDAVTGKIKVA